MSLNCMEVLGLWVLPGRRSRSAQNAVPSGCPVLLFSLFGLAAAHFVPPMFVGHISPVRARVPDFVFLFATVEAARRRFFFSFRCGHVWFGLGHVRHFTVSVDLFPAAVQLGQCSSLCVGFCLFGCVFAGFLLGSFLVDDLKLRLLFMARQFGTAWQLLGAASQQPAAYVRRLFSWLVVAVVPVGDAVWNWTTQAFGPFGTVALRIAIRQPANEQRN